MVWLIWKNYNVFCTDQGRFISRNGFFTLRDDEETRAMYPFRFAFTVRYSLDGSSLRQEYVVQTMATRPSHSHWECIRP